MRFKFYKKNGEEFARKELSNDYLFVAKKTKCGKIKYAFGKKGAEKPIFCAKSKKPFTSENLERLLVKCMMDTFYIPLYAEKVEQ